jgi:inner membrane protease ATP23
MNTTVKMSEEASKTEQSSVAVDQTKASAEPSRCSTLLQEALGRSYIKFVREKMHEIGCDTSKPENFTFSCQPCGTNKVIGFFRADEHGNKGVTICEDNVEQYKISGEHVERTVLHELVHAYDTCRAKVDCNDCRHLACTEIRAALLSGDCDMFNEWRRRNFAFKGQGVACVKRRAELSVAAHPNCAGEKAKQVIEEVFDVCYNDTAPFEQKF